MAAEVPHVPTKEEIVKSGLALEGGVCYTLNAFMDLLLNALGYDSHLISGQYTASAENNRHVAIVVEGLDKTASNGKFFCLFF